MYLIERLTIGSMWLVCFMSLWFIPKHKRRVASFIFLFAQMPAWILGLLVVEAGLIEYPVRELHKANATSFTFEFLVLPLLCVFFNLYYPEGASISKKLAYYIKILSIFTTVEYVVEKYTLVINYLHWEWYFTFASMGIVIYLIRAGYKWFFHKKNPLSL